MLTRQSGQTSNSSLRETFLSNQSSLVSATSAFICSCKQTNPAAVITSHLQTCFDAHREQVSPTFWRSKSQVSDVWNGLHFTVMTCLVSHGRAQLGISTCRMTLGAGWVYGRWQSLKVPALILTRIFWMTLVSFNKPKSCTFGWWKAMGVRLNGLCALWFPIQDVLNGGMEWYI